MDYKQYELQTMMKEKGAQSTPLHDSKLLGITLFHSFISGKLFEVKALGHTNNTGDNGAGKSTLLSLLPAFYGAEPSKLVDREADKASFIDYYLPTAKSLIVFEYLKEGETKCAVLYRNNASLAYRFVACAAKALFCQPLHDILVSSGVDAKSWLRNEVSNVHHVSAQIDSCADYRAVILNNKRHLAQKRRANSGLITMASRFSLCSAEYEMNHIDVLTATMMRHKKMLSRFKKMIVDCFLTDTAMDTVPYHKDHLELIESVDVFVQLESKQYKFDETLANKVELDQLLGALSSFSCAINKNIQTQQAQLDSDKSAYSFLKTEWEAFKNKAKAQEHALSDDAFNAQRDLTRKNQSIDDLYNKRDQYENGENIVEKIAQYDQLSVYSQEEKDSTSHYTRLLEGIKEEEKECGSTINRFKGDESNFKAEKQLDINKIKDIQFTINEEKNHCLIKMQEAYQKECDQISTENKSHILALDDQLFALLRSEGEACHYTPEQRAQLSAIDEEREQKQKGSTQLLGQIIALTRQKEECTKSRDERLSLFHQRKAQYDEMKENISQINGFIEPEAGSLGAFLETHRPDWRTSLGKVIAPHLIKSKQLVPVLDFDQTNESIFGVNLNLNAIETPDFALSHALLLEKRDQLNNALKEILARVEAAKNAAKLDERDLKDCNQEILIKNSAVENLTKETEQLRLMHENKSAVFDEDVKKRQDEIKRRKAALLVAKSQRENETLHALAQKKAMLEKEALQTKADYDFLLSDEEVKIHQIDTLIKEKSGQIKQRIQDVKAAFSRAMQAKGVDEKSIEKAKQVLDKSVEKCKRVEGYADIIREFQSWKRMEWINIDTFKKDLRALTADKARFDAALDDHKNTSKTQTETFIARIKEKNEEIQFLESELKDLLDAISSIEKEMGASFHKRGLNGKDDLEPLVHSGSFAKTFVNEKITDINRLRKNIVRNVKEVSNTLLALEDKNEIKSIWTQKRQARLRQMRERYDYEISEDNSDFSIACLNDLEHFLLYVIPDLRDLRLGSIRSVSTQISNFHETLKQINNKIEKVSNTLVKSIETANPFPAIDSIQIKLSSKIHTYEVWKELNTFALELTKWSLAGKHTLPSKEFVVAFRQLNASFNTVKISKDIESLVEMEITVVENGRSAVIKQDDDLEKVGSEGISKLAIIVVFCGMTRFLCQDKKVTIHWPLDELGKISVSNLTILFNMMTDQSISLFTAQPDPHHGTLKFFTTKNHVVKGMGVKSYISMRSGKNNPLLEPVQVLEPVQENVCSQDAGHQDATHKKAIDQEATHQEATHQEGIYQEATHQEATCLEATYQEERPHE